MENSLYKFTSQCEICGSSNGVHNWYVSSNHIILICEDCMKEHNEKREKYGLCAIPECDNCCDYVNNRASMVYGYFVYCPDCYGELSIKCDICGLSTHEEEITEIDCKNVCNDCKSLHYSRCERCGKLTYDEDLIFTNCDGLHVCPCCFDDYYMQCENCGNAELINEARDGLCLSCQENLAGYLNDAGYKPDWTFYGTSTENSPFMGIELEYSHDTYDFKRNTALSASEEFSDFCILKDDSSLSRGVEIVTMPATLQVLKGEKQAFANFFSKIAKYALTDNAGLHIHIENSYITTEHYARLVACVSNMREFCELIARRSNSSYAKFMPAGLTLKEYGAMNDDRYSAVNSQPIDTIEIRIFKTAKTVQELYAAIEFCHALYNYSRECTDENALGGDVELFMGWVNMRNIRGLYQELIDYVASKQEQQ